MGRPLPERRMARSTTLPHRLIAFVLFVTVPSQGCTHWVDRGRLPREALAAKHETEIRLLVDHSAPPDGRTRRVLEPEWVTIWNARVTGDSLVGTTEPYGRTRAVTVAIDDIRMV